MSLAADQSCSASGLTCIGKAAQHSGEPTDCAKSLECDETVYASQRTRTHVCFQGLCAQARKGY